LNTDVDLASLCKHYEIEIASYMNCAESVNSSTTEPDVTNPTTVDLYCNDIMKTLAAEFDLLCEILLLLL